MHSKLSRLTFRRKLSHKRDTYEYSVQIGELLPDKMRIPSQAHTFTHPRLVKHHASLVDAQYMWLTSPESLALACLLAEPLDTTK